MFGLAEVFIKLFYSLLPSDKLRILQNKLINLRLRAAIPIPESAVQVFATDASNKKLFKECLFNVELVKEDLIPPDYSLITTCRNEGNNIRIWLDSVASQQHQPFEVIIVDAGSTDATLSQIRKWQDENKTNFLIEVYCLEACNIAAGRNLGALKATKGILAFSDVGTELDRTWAKKLLEPFFFLEDLEVSMGWYKAITKSHFNYALSTYLNPKLEQINPRIFLPSARSLAISREVFFSVAGFPEYLSLAGEDSLFDFYLKSSAKSFAFVPEAIAFWHFPLTLAKSFKTIFNYARGDAEGGKLFWADYLNISEQYLKMCFELALFFVMMKVYTVTKMFSLLAITLLCLVFFIFRYLRLVLAYRPGAIFSKTGFWKVLAIMFLTFAQFLGFVRGLFSRKEVLQKRLSKAKAGHVFLFLKEVPTRDKEIEDKAVLKSYLDKNYFVTLIFTGYPKVADVILFQHQFLEVHLRSAFNLDIWKEQHHFLFEQNKKVNFEIIDRVNDSFSWQIVEKINSKR